MAKKVNLKEIAATLNLSVGTVSRVLNGKAKEYRIKEDTVKKVLAYAQEVGYAPNMLAKGLRNSRTYTLGLMIPDIANPFFALMAKHIQRAASEANYTILLVDAEESIDKEKQQLHNMLNRQVDGIICAPVGTCVDHFEFVQKQKAPLVFVDRYKETSDIPFITSDNFQGGFDATNHLIIHGHKRIALIKGDENIEPVVERRRGYEEALTKAGIQIDDNLIVGDGFSEENGYQCTLSLLEDRTLPTAIFAMSNLVGLGVLRALREKGVSIPDDVSLVIYDDQPYVSYLNPPITTIKQDSVLIGKIAVESVLKKIEEKDTVITSQKIPVLLKQRSSVAERT